MRNWPTSYWWGGFRNEQLKEHTANSKIYRCEISGTAELLLFFTYTDSRNKRYIEIINFSDWMIMHYFKVCRLHIYYFFQFVKLRILIQTIDQGWTIHKFVYRYSIRQRHRYIDTRYLSYRIVLDTRYVRSVSIYSIRI